MVPSTATSRTMDPPHVPTRTAASPRFRVRARSGSGGLSPAAPVAVAATWGGITAAVGVAVVVRASRRGWSGDVVELAGTTHTARLGVIEICFGTVMLLAAATRSRVVLAAMAAALAVSGGFMLLERRRVAEELAIGRVDAWLVIGAAACLATLLVCSGSRRA